MLLGALSLVVWFAVAFGLAIVWQVNENRASQIMLAGGIAVALAALPWLGYPRLVEALRGGGRPRREQSADPALQSRD